MIHHALRHDGCFQSAYFVTALANALRQFQLCAHMTMHIAAD